MTVTGPTERQVQRAILRRMATVLPTDAVWLHPANEGPNPDFTRALLGDGMKPGAPDLLLFYAGRAFGMEVKIPGQHPNPVQVAFHARLEAAGCPVAVVRSIPDAEAAWRRWNLPVAATPAVDGLWF